MIHNLLASIGYSKKSARIILLGLDNSGKSTLCHKLKTGETLSFPPTERASHQIFHIGNTSFKAWDIGGHQAVRYLWKDCYAECDAVVFMIDAADVDRLYEAKNELDEIFNNSDLKETPFVILLNKCDLPSCLSTPDLVKKLGIDQEVGNNTRKSVYRYFRTSLISGEGYLEAIKWIAKELSKEK